MCPREGFGLPTTRACFRYTAAFCVLSPPPSTAACFPKSWWIYGVAASWLWSTESLGKTCPNPVWQEACVPVPASRHAAGPSPRLGWGEGKALCRKPYPLPKRFYSFEECPGFFFSLLFLPLTPTCSVTSVGFGFLSLAGQLQRFALECVIIFFFIIIILFLLFKWPRWQKSSPFG